jgi:hypothetical protein
MDLDRCPTVSRRLRDRGQDLHVVDAFAERGARGSDDASSIPATSSRNARAW